MKKGLFGLLAAIFVLTMVVIEFSAPIDQQQIHITLQSKTMEKKLPSQNLKGTLSKNRV